MEPIQQAESKPVNEVPSAAEADRQLRALEERLDRARVAGDVELFDDVIADDFRTISPAGGGSGKEEMLADNRTGNLAVSASESRDISIRVHGKTAIVSGTADLRAKYRGHDISGLYSYTHVYRYADERWQVVAAHSSRQAPDWAYLLYSRTTQLLRLRR